MVAEVAHVREQELFHEQAERLHCGHYLGPSGRKVCSWLSSLLPPELPCSVTCEACLPVSPGECLYLLQELRKRFWSCLGPVRPPSSLGACADPTAPAWSPPRQRVTWGQTGPLPEDSVTERTAKSLLKSLSSHFLLEMVSIILTSHLVRRLGSH